MIVYRTPRFNVSDDQNRVRVNTQLIDAESGAHLWADQFDEDVANLFKLGGSDGILTPDKPQPPVHNFMKTQALPELREIQRKATYADSAEFKIKEAYKAVGKEPPADVMRKIANQ